MPGFDKNKFIISGEELENYLCGICLGVFKRSSVSSVLSTNLLQSMSHRMDNRENTCLMIDKFGSKPSFRGSHGFSQYL